MAGEAECGCLRIGWPIVAEEEEADDDGGGGIGGGWWTPIVEIMWQPGRREREFQIAAHLSCLLSPARAPTRRETV